MGKVFILGFPAVVSWAASLKAPFETTKQILLLSGEVLTFPPRLDLRQPFITFY